MRVESTVTESNGSSSMASVCGGYLALLDAGARQLPGFAREDRLDIDKYISMCM